MIAGRTSLLSRTPAPASSSSFQTPDNNNRRDLAGHDFASGSWDPAHERLVTAAFFTVGVGLLCPYNALISCVDVFADRFGKETEYYVAGATIAPNVITLALSVAYGFPGPPKLRVVGGLVVLTAICAAAPFCTTLMELIFLSCMVGFVGSLVQGSMFALAGRCTGGHTSAVSSGTSLAGIIVCIIRIATKGAAPSTDIATYLYFGSSCLLLVSAIAAYLLVIDKSSLVRMFIVRSTPATSRSRSRPNPQNRRRTAPGSLASGSVPPLQWSPSEGGGSRGSLSSSAAAAEVSGTDSSADALLANDRLLQQHRTAERTLEEGQQQQLISDSRCSSSSSSHEEGINAGGGVGDDELPPGQILRVIWVHAATVFVVMCSTIFIFPGFVAQMSPNYLRDHWWPVLLISVFNVGDFLGRMLTSVENVADRLGLSTPVLMFVSLVRGALVIAAGLATVLPARKPIAADPVLEVVVVLMLGISGGFLGTLAMLLAPLELPETSRARAGAAMTFFLLLGATCGSFAGIAGAMVLG